MSEIDRIIGLPRREPSAPELDGAYLLPGATGRLFPVQRAALAEIEATGGFVGGIGVGHGKTHISILAGEAIARATGKEPRVLLLVPAALVDRTVREVAKLSQIWRFPIPIVRSYTSALSLQNSEANLRALAPALVVADEAHKLCGDSARRRRLVRYLQENPETKIVALSGTITRRSILDFAPLCAWALRGGSPLPLTWHHLSALANVVDSKPRTDPSWADFAIAQKLCDAMDIADPREALRERLRTTPGVILTTSQSCDASIYVHWHDVPDEHSKRVKPYLEALDRDWEIPGGRVFADAMQVARAAEQLAQGFHYVWDWPDGAVNWQWLEARRAWASAVREYVKRAPEGLDTEGLVRVACSTGRAPSPALARAWAVWEPQHKTPEPPRRAVWLCSELQLHAARLAYSTTSLVWFGPRAVGDLFPNVLRTYTDGTIPEAGMPAALPFRVYGTGRPELVSWSSNVIVSPVVSGADIEQLIGRTHRIGQDADEIHVHMYRGIEPFDRAHRSALRDARYLETLQGPQKLLFATHIGGNHEPE